MPQHITDAELEGLQRKLVGARPERMVRELAEALEALTRDTWLVLILEDLHWSDGATIELLDVLARRREPARLMVVGTYRPGEVYRRQHPILGVAQELLLHDHCIELRLPLLSAEAIHDYLKARFPDHAVPQHLVSRLHARTEGNPLFLGAVIQQVWDIDLPTPLGGEGAWDAWDKPEVAEAVLQGVPNTLQQMIERHFAQLPITEQQVLEAGSVVGETFSSAAVAAGLGGEIEQVEVWCRELLRKQFFLSSAGSEGWPDRTLSECYRFVHALYREAVYNQIPPAERLRLHYRVSLRLEQGYGDQACELAAQIAVHCERGQDLWRAVHYRQQAAQNALQMFAYQEAIAHLTKGLELLEGLPDTPERGRLELDLQLTLGPSYSAIKGYAASESRRAYARARELCRQVRPTPQLFPALFGLWTFYFARAECQVAQELGEQLLIMATQAGDTALLLEAHQLVAATAWHRGEFSQARQHLEHSHTLYNPQHHHAHTALYGQDPEIVSLSYRALTLWVFGAQAQSLQASHQAINLAQKLAHPYNMTFAYSLAAILASLRRDVGRTRAHAEAAIGLARAQGYAYWEAHGTVLHGWAVVHQMLEEGIDEMHQGIAAWRRTGANLAMPFYLTLLAERTAQIGRVEEALCIATEAWDVMTSTGERFYEAELCRLQGELWLARAAANRQEAEWYFRKALTVARHQRAKSWEVQAALSLSRLWHEAGKGDAARELLDGVYERFTQRCDVSDGQLGNGVRSGHPD